LSSSHRRGWNPVFRNAQARSQKLRERFGPEYDRVVKQEGDPRKAEGVLEFLEKRRAKFKIRPLSAADRSGFAVRWNEVQSRVVDDPRAAVTVAESLVSEVMQARGYLIGEFEQRAADISVDYPVVVENYRAAHAIALRHSAGQASTEDLRQAMVHDRKLFQELLDERAAQRIGSITMATPLRKDEPQQIDNQKLTTADLAKRQRAITEPKGPRPVLGEGMPAEQNLEQAGREPKQSASGDAAATVPKQ